MVGGQNAGDSTVYVVDDVGDRVVAGAGQDTVQTTLSNYTLGANVEDLVYTGTSRFTASGNTGNNAITGGAVSDNLSGGDGNDSLLGNDGGDNLYGGAGSDTVDGGSGADNLFGNTGNDSLSGGSGNDILNGGTGADTMVGGTGNDIYFVDNASDTIVENINEGLDSAYSSAPSFLLPDNVENLFLKFGASSGTGNNQDNMIRALTPADLTLSGMGGNDRILASVGNDSLSGGTGNDLLFAMGGNDTLDGGAGADTLSGGPGADAFHFMKGEANGDLITDFTVGTDHIDFYGYNAGATFSKVGGVWTVTDGTLHETINFSSSPASLASSDYTFH